MRDMCLFWDGWSNWRERDRSIWRASCMCVDCRADGCWWAIWMPEGSAKRGRKNAGRFLPVSSSYGWPKYLTSPDCLNFLKKTESWCRKNLNACYTTQQTVGVYQFSKCSVCLWEDSQKIIDASTAGWQSGMGLLYILWKVDKLFIFKTHLTQLTAANMFNILIWLTQYFP